MSNQNWMEITKKVVDGTVKVVEACTGGLLGYELIVRIFGGTSIVGTIIRTKVANSVIKSMRNNIPKEQFTEEIVQKIKDTMDVKIEESDE